ncbi:MAG: hypothetical protein OXU61_05985 [Gammaproteobacteria bacterium]|nr:hypothetical protein [Gammaproteobacteria bacterium]
MADSARMSGAPRRRHEHPYCHVKPPRSQGTARSSASKRRIGKPPRAAAVQRNRH